MIPAKKAKYSFKWAESVINRLYAKYPRATDFVCETWDISLKDLATYLAFDDPLLPALRDMIHSCDTYLHIHGNASQEQWKSYIYARFQYIYTGNQRDRLAKRLESCMLKEQGSREGRGRRSEAKPDPTQPFLFEEFNGQ